MERSDCVYLGSVDRSLIFAAAFNLEGTSVKSAVADMLMEAGIQPDEAWAAAEEILSQVGRYTELCDGMNADSVRCAREFLGCFEGRSERERVMKGLLRGFEPDSAVEGLRTDYGADFPDKYDTMAYDELYEAFICGIGRLNVSPGLLGRMLRRASRASDVTAAAAAYGKDGFELKCLTAAYLYRSFNDMGVEEAVAAACCGVDFQAVCDAVSLGWVTARAARGMLIASAAAMGFLAIELIVAAGSAAEIGAVWGAIALVSVALAWIYDRLPQEAGETAIVSAGLVRRGCDAVARGWERLRESFAGTEGCDGGESEYEMEDEEEYADPDYPF